MDRKDLDRPEYGSYEEVHEMLVRAMQDACMNDTSREYESPQIDMSFLYEDEKPKKTMTYKIIRSAAILFLAFGMLLAINAVLLTSDCNDVYGEKGLLHRIHEGVRGIFTDEDPSQFVEVDETGEVFIITDMEDVYNLKEFWEDIVIPNYIPEEYNFVELKVTKGIFGEYEALYEFSNSMYDLKLFVSSCNYADKHLSHCNGKVITEEDRIINIYYDEAYDRIIADVYFDKLIVNIQGKIDERQLLEISQNLY